MSGTTSSANNTAAISKSQEDSQGIEELYHSSRLEEYASICNLLEFVRFEDGLNTVIWEILQAIPKKERSIDGMEFCNFWHR